jgi:hypothetical protein
MTFNNTAKVNYCRYRCGTPIKFDNNQVSASGLKIPLNLDGTPHDCANRPYNRRRHQQLQTSKPGKKWQIKPCKYCSQSITFDDDVTAASGKRIPLNPNGSHHECPNNPYNVARRNQ